MVLETTSKTDQYNCTISNKCLQDGARKNAAKTGTPRARRTAAGEGQADASGLTMQPEKAARLPEEPREREPAAARGLATEAAAAQAAGWASGARRGTARRRGLDDGAGRDAQTKGAALAARCARRMPARLCDCRRCRVGWGDARQRRAHPPAGGFRGHGGGSAP